MTDPRVLVAGETLVDFLPDRPGPLTDVETFVRRPGGAPANVAVALARLGHAPWFWTRVATDPFGDYLADVLAGEGLPDRFVERDARAQTTLAFVAHDEDADRSFSFYREDTADTRLERGTVPGETLTAVDWVVCGGVTLSMGPSREATLDLLERAGEADCTTCFDPNYRPELWDDGFASVVGDALRHVDVLKATAGELRTLGFEGDLPALAAAATERGPHTVLATRGTDGAYAYATPDAPWSSGEVVHGGYRVDPVDATGAGDAFLAGTVAAFLDGHGLDGALDRANAVAATATTDEGAMSALPTADAVDAFLAERS